MHGWEDQRWTLARVRALIARRFRLDCSSAAVWRLMHRHGWSWQYPARRALERDEGAVGPAGWPPTSGSRSPTSSSTTWAPSPSRHPRPPSRTPPRPRPAPSPTRRITPTAASKSSWST
ncbi:winged helix-turn-helix domain-containing protein [Streptomyces sp. NBC_01483]|nr:winged helix-turn-helix domain-containing protein [Streptomyces sp. NBC_01483]